jgi:hypothetical protein
MRFEERAGRADEKGRVWGRWDDHWNLFAGSLVPLRQAYVTFGILFI